MYESMEYSAIQPWGFEIVRTPTNSIILDEDQKSSLGS